MLCSRTRLTAAVAAAALLTAASAPARAHQPRLTVGAAVPAVVPMTMTTNVGSGVLPTLQLNLSPGWGLNLVSGFVYYWEDTDAGKHAEKEIPILVGVSYALNQPSDSLRPYASLKLGYTHAIDSDESSHWITAAAGGGVRIRCGPRLAFDTGVDVLIPDFRGNARDHVGLLFKLGAHVAVL